VTVREHEEEREQGREAGWRRDEAPVSEERLRRGERRAGGGEVEHARVVRGGEVGEVRGQEGVHGRRGALAGGGDQRVRHGSHEGRILVGVRAGCDRRRGGAGGWVAHGGAALCDGAAGGWTRGGKRKWG
jgi:hypothetical protein